MGRRLPAWLPCERLPRRVVPTAGRRGAAAPPGGGVELVLPALIHPPGRETTAVPGPGRALPARGVRRLGGWTLARTVAPGQGANILTITRANPATFAGAAEEPEKYNLLRVRMGGGSEFFVVMYPAHQPQYQQHLLSDAVTPW